MDIIVCYALIYLIEAIILWQYSDHMFASKTNLFMQIFFVILLYCIPFALFFLENIWLNSIAFLSINFIYLLFIFRIRWYTALFHATTLTITMSASELVVVGLISQIAYDFYENSSLRNIVILAVLSKTLYFFSLQIIIHFWKDSKHKFENYDFSTTILTFIPVLTLFIVHTLATICTDTILSSTNDRLICTSAFLILIINIIVFGIYNYTQKRNQQFTELQLQLQKEYDLSEYYQMLLEQHENQSILIHDIKKHLNSLALLNQEQETQKIDNYIREIMSSSDLQFTLRVSDNDMLNAIMSRYIQICKAKSIDLRIDIRKHCLNFMRTNDLTALICNLMDNAYESASLQEQSFIDLHISKKEGTPFTLLTLVNSCRVNPFVDSYGTLVTRKKDKMRHGYGVKSIKRVVAAYGGEIEMYYDKETLTFHTVLTLRNQPD